MLKRAKRICGRIVLILVSFFLVCLILEIGLRLFGYEGAGGRKYTRFDHWMGQVPAWDRPSLPVDLPGDMVKIRNRIFPRKKEPGQTRVIFVGDSGMFALVPFQRSFPLRFKALLDEKQPGNKVEVINAGIAGMTTIDEFLFVKEQLFRLSPDVVVLGLFMANDITFNLAHREYTAERHAPSSIERGLFWMKARSALCHFIYLRLLALNARYRLFSLPSPGEITYVPLEIRLVDEDGLHMLNYAHGEIATYRRKSSPLANYSFQVFEKVLANFQLLAEEKGFTFVVALIPTASTIAGELRLAERFADDVAEVSGKDETILHDLDFDKPARRVKAICRRLSIPCVDATPRMRRAEKDTIIPGDDHLTVDGHNVLAEELVERYPY